MLPEPLIGPKFFGAAIRLASERFLSWVLCPYVLVSIIVADQDCVAQRAWKAAYGTPTFLVSHKIGFVGKSMATNIAYVTPIVGADMNHSGSEIRVDFLTLRTLEMVLPVSIVVLNQ